jgi:hypothetical protein
MTQRRITIALVVVAGLLGLVHLALATLIYGSWNADALWFVGTGFAIVIGAAANLVAMDAQDRASRSVLVIINTMMVGFFAAAWSVLPGPQVIVGGLLFAGLAVCAWRTASLKPQPSAER